MVRSPLDETGKKYDNLGMHILTYLKHDKICPHKMISDIYVDIPFVFCSSQVYKKHHPPSLSDEVWRLEKIGKDGAFHKRLRQERVNTVKDFLILLFLDPKRLRNVRFLWYLIIFVVKAYNCLICAL